jgi:uncharacterized protein YukJ
LEGTAVTDEELLKSRASVRQSSPQSPDYHQVVFTVDHQTFILVDDEDPEESKEFCEFMAKSFNTALEKMLEAAERKGAAK